MLQVLGIVLIIATTGAMIVTIVTALFERRGAQITAAAFAAGWIGFLTAMVASGALKYTMTLPALFAVPFVIAAISIAASPAARERLRNIPRRLILAMNIFRVSEFLFVALAFAGALAGPFPYSAGIGDVVVGLLAIPLTLGEPRLARSDLRLGLWNALGLLDLLSAVALGVTSINHSPLQLIHAGAGADQIMQLPWALIPLFLVPCYVIGHVIVFVQMRPTVQISLMPRVENRGAGSTS